MRIKCYLEHAQSWVVIIWYVAIMITLAEQSQLLFFNKERYLIVLLLCSCSDPYTVQITYSCCCNAQVWGEITSCLHNFSPRNYRVHHVCWLQNSLDLDSQDRAAASWIQWCVVHLHCRTSGQGCGHTERGVS